MICPQCGAQNRPAARFCRACRAALSAATCPHCHAALRPTARFCAGCGRRVAWDCARCGYGNRVLARYCAGCGQPPGRVDAPLDATVGLSTGELVGCLLKGRYRLHRLVGQGGMAAVYQASDLHAPGQVWAVKAMSNTAVPSEDLPVTIDAFRREGELLMRLSHPNLPRAYEVFEEAGRHFMTLEFIDGQTLADILQQTADDLDEERVLHWARQVCDVLSYLHHQTPPIIYRDLKPQNIMEVTVSRDIKLIDFGTVRFYKGGQRKDTLALGTEGYAPPEQHGRGQTDARSDVYALGKTLHELLTRQSPATRGPFEPPPPVTLSRPALSAAWDGVIATATQLAPADRYQSVAAMLKALPTPSGSGNARRPSKSKSKARQASPRPAGKP